MFDAVKNFLDFAGGRRRSQRPEKFVSASRRNQGRRSDRSPIRFDPQCYRVNSSFVAKILCGHFGKFFHVSL
jgi:hypothetical protein